MDGLATRNFWDSWSPFSGEAVSHIITASVQPAIQSVQDGDTWADLLLASATTASNYDSSASANDPTPVAEVRIDGGAWTALSGNEATVLSYDEEVQVRVTVTDDQDPANVRVFGPYSTTVAGIAPDIAAMDSLSGRVLTITVTTLTGVPTPTVSAFSFIVNGEDVTDELAETVEDEEFVYEFPSSAIELTGDWQLLAENAVGQDTASGSETVASDYTAPTYTVSLAQVYDGQTVDIPGSGADVEAVLSGSDGIPAGDYTWSATVDGAPASLPITAVDATDIILTIADANHPTGAFSASSNTVTVETSPITATLEPAMSPLYDGQAVQDVTNWSSFINTANYASSAGGGSATIVSAVPAFTGDAIAADDALVEGESAGFNITVTDDQDPANELVFAAVQIVVQYAVRAVDEGDGFATIEWNPLAEGSGISRQITLTIDGTDYTPTLTEGDEDTGPINVAAPAILGDTPIGSTLTLDWEGAWATETASVTFTHQWNRNGTPISGATGSTYTTVSADAETDITCTVTGTDTNGSRPATSNAITVDAAAATFSVTQTAYLPHDKGSRTSDAITFSGVNLGSGTNPIQVFLTMLSGSGADNLTPTTFTVRGATGTKRVGNAEDGTTTLTHTVCYEFAAPGATTGDIVVGNTGQFRGAAIEVHEVAGGYTVPVTAQEASGTGAVTTLSANMQAGDVFLGMTGASGMASTITWSGAVKTGTDKQPWTDRWVSTARHDATTTETPRAITCTYGATPARRSGVGIVLRAS